MEEKLNLKGCSLYEAKFRGVDLRNINLTKTNLTCAEFYNCDLQGVSFEGSNLWGAKFINSNLFGVNLKGATVRYMTVENSRGILQFGPIDKPEKVCFAVDWGNKIMFRIDNIWEDTFEAKYYAETQHWDKSAIEQISQMEKMLKEQR